MKPKKVAGFENKIKLEKMWAFIESRNKSGLIYKNHFLVTKWLKATKVKIYVHQFLGLQAKT